jgi:hypothetical protein
MPTVAVWKESSCEYGDLKCCLSRRLINFKNRRNFDERTKFLAPTVLYLLLTAVGNGAMNQFGIC